MVSGCDWLFIMGPRSCSAETPPGAPGPKRKPTGAGPSVHPKSLALLSRKQNGNHGIQMRGNRLWQDSEDDVGRSIA